MSPLVVDASVAATWLLDDESDARAEAALALLEQVPGVVPQLWHFEMRNILLVAWRRGRISDQGLAERVAALAELPLSTDAAPDLAAALDLAARHGLSFYDGLYLEAARRLGATLASLDQALVRAARAEGLAVPE
ncbi:MAG: type II toxin-antitoxin system VapC family toxin [Armatimonadota bacterium]|nr:type II toxin-antitoxin system VapC family toxin [Armatimonadota bacterium]